MGPVCSICGAEAVEHWVYVTTAGVEIDHDYLCKDHTWKAS